MINPPASSAPLNYRKQGRHYRILVADVCGTVSRFSYIRNIDVSFVLEEAALEASGFHGVSGCVTSSLSVA
jgi:hypothetical protein